MPSLPSLPVICHSHMKKHIQLRPDIANKEMVTPEDQEKRVEASSSAVASKSEPLSNRPAPTMSSFARLAREEAWFSLGWEWNTLAWLGKLLGNPSNKVKMTRPPAGRL